MENIIRTTGVVAFKNGEVLLVRHGKRAEHLTGTYGIPAGRLEEGEKVTDAAIRKLKEESGLTTNHESLTLLPETYTAKIQRKDGIKTFSLEVFLCRHYKGELRGVQEPTPEWVSIGELDRIKLLPNMKKIVLDALKMLGQHTRPSMG